MIKKPKQKNIPVSDNPAKDDGLFLKQSGAEMRKGRLDHLQSMYLDPEKHDRKIAMFEIRELREERPLLFAKETAKSSASSYVPGTLRTVAVWIANCVPGCNPNHNDIGLWKKGRNLPSGCKESFPAKNTTNTHSRAEVVAWCEKYLVKAASSTGSGTLDDRQRREKAEADMAEMEAESQRKKLSGLYVLTETAERTGTAIGIAIRTITREAIERQIPKRCIDRFAYLKDDAERTKLSSEITADCIAVFTDWQRQAQSRLDELIAATKAEEGGN